MLSAVSSALRIIHFRHQEAAVGSPPRPPEAGNNDNAPLTLVIRKDACFATSSIAAAFCSNARTVTGLEVPKDKVADILKTAYRSWGTEVVSATTECLNYEGTYHLPSETTPCVHMHSADALAREVINKACLFLQKNHAEKPQALFVSLDNMIGAQVFRASHIAGTFNEIGFSRIFSNNGDELGFTGRPGYPCIEEQVRQVRAQVEALYAASNAAHRIPIILLEDNVRRAKTLVWIFNEMQKGGVFEHGKLMGVATCFSVATEDEKKKIVCEGREIPLIIGTDYADKKVDVITPRDHLFDGFVTKDEEGTLQRMPSFLLPADRMASNFKLAATQVGLFFQRVMQANIDFCSTVMAATGSKLPLSSFTSGAAVAMATGAPAETPMRDVLCEIARNGLSLGQVAL